MNFFKNLFASVPAISVAELQDKMQNGQKPVLLDVRTTAEYREGHIPGAANKPLQALNGRLKNVSRNREVICICRSGNRSRRAVKHLQEAGYTAVNLKGGMRAWDKAGYKIKKGKAK